MNDVNRVLNAKITVQKKIISELIDFGDYEDYIVISAETKFTRSRFMSQARSENTKKFITFVIRSRDDLDETMRIIYNDEPWEIESIIPITNERLYTQIECYRIMNDIMGEVYE